MVLRTRAPTIEMGSVGTKLEGEVNAWLADHPGVRVILVKQSSCGGSAEPSKHVVTVWYEPKTEPGIAPDRGRGLTSRRIQMARPSPMTRAARRCR